MCVIAPGYYPTLVRVDTKGCEVLLLDEQRHTAVREEADVNWFDDLKQTGRVFCRRTILADLELYPYIRWDNSEWITRGNMRYPAESRLPFDSFERYIQDGVGAEEAKKVGWILFFLCSRSVPTKYYYHVEEELAAEETPSFLKQAPNERARIYTPAFIQDELTEAQRKELNLK